MSLPACMAGPVAASRVVSAVPVTKSHRGISATLTAGVSSYTWTSFDIGTAAADRIVLVCVANRDPVTSDTPTAMTIGGVSATALTSPFNGGTIVVRWFAAVVPTGTTADIFVQFSGAVNSGCISVYAVYGSELPQIDEAGDNSLTGNALSADVAVTDGDAVFAVAAADTSTQSASVGWTVGPTEDQESVVTSALRASSASLIVSADDATYTVTATFGGAPLGGWAMAAVVFGPVA